MSRTEQVYIGLGSNLEAPREQISRALKAIDQLPGSHLSATSSLYRSPPMGPQDQPDYLNAVAEISTTLAPLELLEQLQLIEKSQGRLRNRRWGARTIDLDLLLYGQGRVDHPRLQVPHPGIGARRFVLVPLQELAGPELQIPGQGRVGSLLRQCNESEITEIAI